MGCPQSKQKNISADGGDVTKPQERKLRNDVIKPEAEKQKHVPTKTPHEYNNDALVKGRCDDVAPGVNVTEVISKESNKTKEETSNKSEAKEEKENVKPQKLNEKKEKDETGTKQSEESNSETKQPIVIKNNNEISDIKFNSVFVLDKNPPTDLQDDKPDDAIDVNDVNISPTINEITLDNQVISENGTGEETTEDKPEAGPAVQTQDGYEYREPKSPWLGKSSVRYLNNNKIEYGVPEGAPKPKPPTLKKRDIVNATTFTLADKLVDETPDDGFSSINKLAGFLTGTKKKAEIQDEDGDDTESRNLPPPKPVTTKKKDIVDSPSVFKHIDENARNTPDSVRLSVDRLAAHLCSKAKTDVEKVRAFYYWICNNISYVYDREKTLSDKLRFDAVSTLRQGQGSYVNLMVALCKEVGIPAVTIPGCSKGLRHQPEREFTIADRNHSWNAVYVNDEWRFIDCTWGSGYVDANGKFQRQFDEFWFLTDPEIFAYDHFPSHSLWQLLAEPIEIEEFNRKPSLTEKSRELGFRLISHREPIVYFENEVTVVFSTETYPLSNITADLKDSSRNEINEHRCMKRVDKKTFEVRVVPPEVGEYTLMLYGKARDYRHAKFRKLMEYTLRCEAVASTKVIFPAHSKAWGPEPNFKDLGFSDSIENLSVFKSDSAEMSIELEQTKNIPVIAELKAASDYKTELVGCTMITASENCKVVHVRFPTSGFFRLDVYAEGESEKYEYVALFLLECTTRTSFKKFPKYNADAVSKHVCEIIDPRDLEIPANSQVTFRLKSPKLRNAMLGVPAEQDYGTRMKGLGELKKNGDIFEGQISTPGPGKTILLSGCAAPPNVFWSRVYEYVTK